MRRILIFFIVTIYCTVKAIPDPAWLEDGDSTDERELFEKFKQDFRHSNRVYSSEGEEKMFRKFQQNKKRVEENRKLYKMGHLSYQEDINKFADWDDDEFLPTHCGTSPNFAVPSENVTTVTIPQSRQFTFAPPYWDIRLHGPGCLTSVKDQGDCGACWAFAAAASIENLYCKRKPESKPSLSNQQQLDCNKRTYGCDGGWFTTAFEYTKTKGLTLEENYPYVFYQRSCRETEMQRTFVHKDFVKLANDANTIKAQLRTKGACACCVDANKWKLYSTGIFNGAGSSPECNHAVTLVGYGPDYWLIKNSWGTDWGEDGYIKVSNQKSGGFFPEYVYCPTM